MFHFLLAIHLSAVQLFFYINSPVIDMHENPLPHAEVVSQAYFSEEVKILEEQADWVKIQTHVDQYVGWTDKKNVCERKTPFFYPENKERLFKISRCAAHVYEKPTVRSSRTTLPFESQLLVVEEVNHDWFKVQLVNTSEAFIQKGDLLSSATRLDLQQMCELSSQFIGLPYTWGGRSSFGYDCSGFVQMLYRQMGIFLPRDSKDQANWKGFQSISLEDLMPGDLIFFGSSENKISHVGMYLGNNEFIHATTAENAPYIHKSFITDPEWNGSQRYRCARRLISTHKL